MQYNETDFSFVSRLMESAGITYYFEHKRDDQTKLRLIDEPHREATRTPPIIWDTRSFAEAEVDYVTNVRLTHRVRLGKVGIRDYDFHNQADFKCLGESKPVEGPESTYEAYYYEPGALRVKAKGSDTFADENGQWAFRHVPEAGHERAARVLDSIRNDKRTVTFETNCVGLHPGRVFGIGDHPRAEKDLGPDDTLLVVEYQMDGGMSEPWSIAGEAVFTSAPYMPHLKTPKPRIAGVQSAIVVGKEGEEIYPRRIRARKSTAPLGSPRQV